MTLFLVVKLHTLLSSLFNQMKSFGKQLIVLEKFPEDASYKSSVLVTKGGAGLSCFGVGWLAPCEW